MSHLATRLAAAWPSASMVAAMAARPRQAKRQDVIDPGPGGPDVPTPSPVAEAAQEAAPCGETLCTAAARTALTRPQDCDTTFRAAFERCRDPVAAGIAGIPGLTLPPPGGAFQARIGCGGPIGNVTPVGKAPQSDSDVPDHLPNHAHVGSVPGAAFGVSPFLRISTTTSDAVLTEAIARIGRAVVALFPAKAA